MSEIASQNKPLPPGWDELGAELVETITRHYSQLRDDLSQMRALLEDAISKLVSAYHILQAQAKVGQEVMRAAREEADELDDEQDEEDDGTNSFGKVGISAALTALQFEDVLTQLLERLGNRCDRFHPLPETLVDSVVETARERAPETERESSLEQLRERLANMRTQVENEREQDINQHDMEAGSVELF